MLQAFGVHFPEFCDLRGYNGRAVRLVGIVDEILLMIVFRRPELLKWDDLGNDRVRVDRRRVDLADDILGRLSLGFRMIKDR